MKKWEKTLIGLSILIVLGNYCIDHNYDTSTIDIVDGYYYATYSDGCVYIGDKCFLDEIDCNEGDILIENLSDDDDPNFKIIDSKKIIDKNKRNEILEKLCCYESEYPSRWDRSIESMRLEWFMHNIGYDNGLETKRTKDVDLNNEDENKYNNKVLSKIFRL